MTKQGKAIKAMKRFDKAVKDIEIGARMKTLRQLQNLMEKEDNLRMIKVYSTRIRELRNQVRRLQGELGSQKD